MSELTNQKKKADFAQLASDINEVNRYLTTKNQFVLNHYQSTKLLIQQYFDNNKTEEQKLALSKDISSIVSFIKRQNAQLNNDITNLQLLQAERKAKLLSVNQMRIQYNNECNERFLLINVIKEKDSYERKLKEDLDQLKQYCFLRELKRDCYLNVVTANPFDCYNEDSSSRKKQSKKKKKIEEQFESYHSKINKVIKELKMKEYQQRIDEGFIWKTVNEKYKSEISINMDDISAGSISNCSSNSNDIFSIGEINDNDNDDYNNNDIIIKEEESKIRKLSNMAEISQQDRGSNLNHFNKEQVNRRTMKSLTLSNHHFSSLKNIKEVSDEMRLTLLRNELNELSESIKVNQSKVNLYRNHNKKLKEHINMLRLKIHFLDFGITNIDTITKNTFGFSANSFTMKD